MTKKTVLSWILIILMILLSCCTNDTTGQTPSMETVEYTEIAPLTDRDAPDARCIEELSSYQMDNLDGGFGLTRFGCASFSRDGFYYAEQDDGFIVYDHDGNQQKNLTFTAPNDDKILAFTYTEAGEFLVLTTNGIGVELYLMDGNSTVQKQISLPDPFSDLPDTVIRTHGDSIYLLQANTFAVYDRSLTLQKTLYFPGDAYGKMHVTDDGTVYIGAYLHSLYTVDLTSGAFVPYENANLPGELADASVHFDTADMLYLANGTGIYSTDGDALSCALEWASGGVKYSTTMDLRIFDKNSFAVYANNPITFRASFQKITSLVIEGEPRRVITLGLNTPDTDGHIAALIFNFNSTNTKYYIEAFHYNDKYSGNVNDGIAEEFLTGTEPDMVIGLATRQYETLTDKGAFVDLNPYFGDQLLGGVRTASMINGILPYIPLGMTVTTLCSNDPADRYLSMQTLYEEAAQLGDGQYLFSDPHTGDYIYDSVIRTFYDAQTKQCTFDSAAFCDFIRFTEQIAERYTNPELGYFNNSVTNINTMLLSDPSVRDHLANGTLRYLTTEIRDISQLACTKFLLGGEQLSLCGLPTENGGACIDPFYTISITATSDVQGGAAEFLSFVLSKEAMTASTLTRSFLPTTPDALRVLLDAYTYYYFNTDPAAWQPYVFSHDPSGQQPDVVGVQMYASHQSEVPDMERAVRNIGGDTVLELVLTEQDKENFLAILNSSGTISSAANDTVIVSILEEELSAYQNGAKTLEDVSKLIQSRVWIYLNE